MSIQGDNRVYSILGYIAQTVPVQSLSSSGRSPFGVGLHAQTYLRFAPILAVIPNAGGTGGSSFPRGQTLSQPPWASLHQSRRPCHQTRAASGRKIKTLRVASRSSSLLWCLLSSSSSGRDKTLSQPWVGGRFRAI